MRKKTNPDKTIGGRKGATCRELLAVLNDYAEGSIDPRVCRELEGHLARCNPCRVVVDNVRKTITLFRNDRPCALPVRFRRQLHAALRECWKQPPTRKARPAR
jgi:hypothetical protein